MNEAHPMGTLRFFEEVVSFKIRRTFGFADYTFGDGGVEVGDFFREFGFGQLRDCHDCGCFAVIVRELLRALPAAAAACRRTSRNTASLRRDGSCALRQRPTTRRWARSLRRPDASRRAAPR